MAIDQVEFRAVLGRFASGVTVLTARDKGGKDHGMTASAFCSVSLDPPLVLACVSEIAEMHPVIRDAATFAVNVLGEHQESLSRRFAELTAGRFDGIGYTRAESGVILLDDAIAHLECSVVDRRAAGDHLICLGQVEWAQCRQDRPLLYYRGGYAQLER